MIDLFGDSFEQVPRRILLDIDDTLDRVPGGRQLSLFHAHYDRSCFLSVHIYEAVTGKPVAVILRPGQTPDGAEVALVLRHLIEAIRRRWPKVESVIRGDSHYARPEAMTLRGLLAASLPEIGSKASWPSMAGPQPGPLHLRSRRQPRAARSHSRTRRGRSRRPRRGGRRQGPQLPRLSLRGQKLEREGAPGHRPRRGPTLLEERGEAATRTLS